MPNRSPSGVACVRWQVPKLGDVQMRRGLAAEAQRLWLQQAFDASSGSVSDLHREVAAALTVLGEMAASVLSALWRSRFWSLPTDSRQF
jgi:hypothetical protein